MRHIKQISHHVVNILFCLCQFKSVFEEAYLVEKWLRIVSESAMDIARSQFHMASTIDCCVYATHILLSLLTDVLLPYSSNE